MRVQQQGEKLTIEKLKKWIDFLGSLQTLVIETYFQEPTGIGEHLFLRGFIECIENSQVQIDLKNNLCDADKTLHKALKRALYIEAVLRIEELLPSMKSCV